MERKTVPIYWHIFTVFGIVMIFNAIRIILLALRVMTWQEIPKTAFTLYLIFGVSLVIAGLITRKKSKNK